MIPSREEAEEILHSLNCSQIIIKHSKTVRDFAIKISKRLIEKEIKVDLDLVEAGALLHDIGRVKTHSVLHGFYGGEIAKALNLSPKLINIIERHIGAGIPADEAVKIGLPRRDFTPETLEEKIICYADKRVKHSKIVSFEKTLEEFKRRLGEKHLAIKRLEILHAEIFSLTGNLSSDDR